MHWNDNERYENIIHAWQNIAAELALLALLVVCIFAVMMATFFDTQKQCTAHSQWFLILNGDQDLTPFLFFWYWVIGSHKLSGHWKKHHLENNTHISFKIVVVNIFLKEHYDLQTLIDDNSWQLKKDCWGS